jgi:hypothetical protein
MRALVLLSLLGLLAPLHAQGGGFAAGDMLLFSPVIQGLSSSSGALVYVQPGAGTATILVDTEGTATGVAAFDPWRQRAIFRGSPVSDPANFKLWAVDTSGALDDLGSILPDFGDLAPTGDGRIYMQVHGGAAANMPFAYLDQAGDLNTLLDTTGTMPFALEGNPFIDVRGMVYHPGTQALFVASPANAFGTGCSGATTDRVTIRKLPLSADGSRVVGPVQCTEFEVSASVEEVPVGWSLGPGGEPVLVVDTNSSAKEPRMVLVDPVAVTASTFASSEYPSAAATNAGTWCSALGKVVILDTGADVLRAFGAGESGDGTMLTVTGTVSAPFSSGEGATLVEVPPSACQGGWGPYGTGLAGKGGFVPRLLASGCPQIGGAFTLKVDRAVGGASGMLFVGVVPAAVPFKGGTFLVGGLALQLPLALGGAPGAAGAGSVTLPAGLPGDPALQGVQIYLQGALHDAAAVKGASLTKGLRMEIG